MIARRLAIIIFALAGAMYADAVELSATLSTNKLNVGDRVTLSVTAIHNADERCLIPSIERDPFVVVWDRQTVDEVQPDNRTKSVTEFTFTSFVIGEHRVATNPVVTVLADGGEVTNDLPLLLIEVVSVLSNPPPALAEIKPPINAPGHQLRNVAFMLLLVTAVALIAAFIIRWWLRRPKAPVKSRVIPPHEIALSALAALRGRGFLESGEAEPFYVELSAIIRIYLEQRFDLHAPEQTTEEFIRTSSQSSALSLEHRQLTQDFLEQSDLVKFARFAPGATEMESALAAAERLVRETIPGPVTGGPS